MKISGEQTGGREIQTTATRRERWGVVGGGILGMTLAHELARLGEKVTLFEGTDRLGGLAGPWTVGPIEWDRYYHVILMSDTETRSLLDGLGLEGAIRWVETRTGFYTDGALHSMSNTFEFLAFPPLGLLDKIRLGATIFYASKIRNWRRLETMLVSEWLTRWSGKSTFEKIWEPLLRAKLGENYKRTSAAFIWATIARMYGARRTGLKKEMFGYVPGGYGSVIRRFREVLEEQGVEIRLNHMVSAVESVGGGGVSIACKNGSCESFERAVLTVACPIAAAICDGLSDGERETLIGIDYQGVICASLLLKKPLAGYYVTNITERWVPYTAVIEMSSLVDAKQFDGHSLVYLPKYVPPGDPAFAMSDSEIEESFLTALIRMYPDVRRDDVAAFRVSRSPFVMAIPTRNYSERLPSFATSMRGVSIVNTAQIINGTLNINETVRLARQACRWLLENPVPENTAAGRVQPGDPSANRSGHSVNVASL